MMTFSSDIRSKIQSALSGAEEEVQKLREAVEGALTAWRSGSERLRIRDELIAILQTELDSLS